MRRLNSSIKVDFSIEKGMDSVCRTYFAYVPLEDMVCYAVAESYDDDYDINSAKIAVDSVLVAFERKPSFKKIKHYIKYAHEQVRVNSSKNKLEAAITVVVSDYTRMRYASCGNIRVYLLSDNAFILKSDTQTYYQFSANEYGVNKAQPSEYKNLLQYLGSDKSPKPYVSKKVKLPDKSSILFATGSFWARVEDIEVLDAYEDSKPEEFLGNLEDLLLHNTQLKKLPVRSYALTLLYADKTFKEDTLKIKRRRRRIIIFSIIATVIAIILLIIFLSIRARDRRQLNEIDRLNNAGVRYANLENFLMSYEQFNQANELVMRLRNNWLFRREKRYLTDQVLDRWNLLNRIVRGDSSLADGNLMDAHWLYDEAYNMVWAHEDLMIAVPLAYRRWQVKMLISADHLVQVSEMYEIEGMYQEALSLLIEAEDIARELADLPLRRDMMARVFEINRIINSSVEVDFIRHVQTLMARAEDNLNFPLALQYSEFVINVYDDLGITNQQALADNARILNNIELDVIAAGYRRNAAEAEFGLRYADAINNYEIMLVIYGEMGISVSHARYRSAVDEILRLEGIMAEMATPPAPPTVDAEPENEIETE